MKRFLLITSTNLASNPRLVKELNLCLELGFHATVIQFRVGNWSDELTIQMEANYQQVRFINLSATRKPVTPWLISSLLQKVYLLFNPTFLSTRNLAIATGKRSLIILHVLKSVKIRYDWVVAHNPAAFYPALYISQKLNSSLGFDIEDYHPGETTNKRSFAFMKELMQRLLPMADYCSYAAPLIAKEVQEHISSLKNKQVVVLNGFSSSEFVPPDTIHDHKLKLVWFSQNINCGRGLENVIAAMSQLHPFAELHLIGNPDPWFIRHIISDCKGIFIHQPMPQPQLHHFLSSFDIGLALDLPVNRNRELAVTNKIIAYAQAGLYIVGFHSNGQSDFLTQHNLYHSIIENTQEAVSKSLSSFSIHEIRQLKPKQYQLGVQFDWGKLKGKLSSVWTNNYK